MTVSEDATTVLLEIEQDARTAEYEQRSDCWRNCKVFDTWHFYLDQDEDRREDQAIAAGIPFLTQEETEQFTGPFGEWHDLSTIDPDQLPFE